MKIDLIGDHGANPDIIGGDSLTKSETVNLFPDLNLDLKKWVLRSLPGVTASGAARTYYDAFRVYDSNINSIMFITDAGLWQDDSTKVAEYPLEVSSSTAIGRNETLISTAKGGYIVSTRYGVNVWALKDTRDITGTSAASPTANKLEYSGGLGDATVGMKVQNTSTGAWAEITALDSSTIVSLDTDIFLVGSETFEINFQSQSGTNTTATNDHLIDSGASFLSGGIVKGMTVKNVDLGLYAFVSNVTETDLTLSDNIFTAAGGTGVNYEVGKNFDWCTKSSDIGDSVEYMDGFFISNPSKDKFQITEYNNPQRKDALDFATAEQSADNLNAIIRSNRTLYLIGEETTEPWLNTGGEYFPFSPNTAGTYQIGTHWAETVVRVGDSAMWLGRDASNKLQIVIADSQGIRPVQNLKLAHILNDYQTTLTKNHTITASTVTYENHTLYVLNMPIIPYVAGVYDLCYDLTTDQVFKYYLPNSLHQGGRVKYVVEDNSTQTTHGIRYNDTSRYKITGHTDVGNDILKTRVTQRIQNGDDRTAHKRVVVKTNLDIYHLQETVGLSGFVFTDGPPFTEYGIVNNVDKAKNLTQDFESVITSHSTTSLNAAGAWDYGDYFQIIDGVTGEVKTGNSSHVEGTLYWRNDGLYNSGITKKVGNTGPREQLGKFHRLGSAKGRDYKLEISNQLETIIEDFYLEI